MIDDAASRLYDGIYCGLCAAHERLSVTKLCASARRFTSRRLTRIVGGGGGGGGIAMSHTDDLPARPLSPPPPPPPWLFGGSSLTAIKSVSPPVTRYDHAPI